MVTNEQYTSAEAELLIEKHLKRTATPTKYIAGFQTNRGTQIALERTRKSGAYLWVEKFSGEALNSRPAIVNNTSPGKPYEKGQGRNSNLNNKNAPNLTESKKAWYLRFDSEPTLSNYLNWLVKTH